MPSRDGGVDLWVLYRVGGFNVRPEYESVVAAKSILKLTDGCLVSGRRGSFIML